MRPLTNVRSVARHAESMALLCCVCVKADLEAKGAKLSLCDS